MIGRTKTALKLRSLQCRRKLTAFAATKTCPLIVGDLELRNPIVLSPLERVADVGFRNLCFNNGAALTFTEMVYASDFVRNRQTDLIDTFDETTLTGVQLLVDKTTRGEGWGTTLLRQSLQLLEARSRTDRPEWQNIVAIDLNFGCPSPAISKRGAGPAQLRRSNKIKDLFQVLYEWKQSTTLNIQAIGAKIRLGSNLRDQQAKVYVPVARSAAKYLDFLTVHARHGQQRSREQPTWSAIAEVVQTIAQTPSSQCKVFGNGDVRTWKDTQAIMDTTGCHGVMLGRAAMRNPWCFGHLAAQQEEDYWPSLDQVEAAESKNEAWSCHRAADARYRRFRKENFARLRDIASQGAPPPASDWYEEWSQASTRRKLLNKMDDEEYRREQAKS